MRVMLVSKALVWAMYRRKLSELARFGVEVIAVVPPAWKEGKVLHRLEGKEDPRYRLVVTPIRLNGHFHLHSYPELSHLMETFRPDLVHVDEEPYNLATYLAVRAADRAGIPSLFFTWQNLVRRYPLPFRFAERWVYRHVSYAISGSEAAVDVLRKKGYAGPAAVVPQFGVDPHVFHPRSRGRRSFTVGFLNRLIEGKAPLVAIEAFASLPDDARMRVVGDGPLRREVEAEIVRRGLGRRVTVEQRVASTQVPELIGDLDVLLLPSITTGRWKEQFGRVLIEAMSSGVPVIGSDSGEIPEVLGDAGLIVPEGNAAALATRLKVLYGDPYLRGDLGQRGRQRVLENYTHTRIAQLTYDIYCQILHREGGMG